MKKYTIHETIMTKNNEKRYCLNKITGMIFGTPIVEEVAKGTMQDVKDFIKNNNIDMDEEV